MDASQNACYRIVVRGLLLAGLLVCAAPAGARQSVKKLERRLADAKSVEELIAVVQALGRTRKPEAARPLARLFDARKNSPRLSLAIVRAFALLRAPSAEAPLTGAWDYLNSVKLQLGEEVPPHLLALRHAVVEALGEVGTDRAGDVLLEALGDKDPAVVAAAARGLGRMRERRAVEPLVELLARGGAVAQAAFDGLADIGEPRSRAPLERALRDEDPLVQAQAAYALARVDKRGPGQAALVSLLASERAEPGARSLAAYYLARLDRPEGLKFLETELLKGTTARRTLASDMLGKSGNPKAAAPLIDALRSPDASLRETAVRGLSRLGGHRVVHALEGLKDDPNVSVRAAAKNALAELGEE